MFNNFEIRNYLTFHLITVVVLLISTSLLTCSLLYTVIVITHEVSEI